jgi:hypothetical protein
LDPYTAPQLQNAIPVEARPNGEFEIVNIRPGSYDLYPEYRDTDLRRYLTSRTPIEVRNSNVTGLKIVVTQGSPLSGEVRIEGSSSQAIKMDSIRLTLSTTLDETLPGSFGGIAEAIPVDASGKFSAGNIPEAKYNFRIAGLPDGAYVVDIRQLGVSVYDSGFTVSTRNNPVQIVVNPVGGTIEGIVMGPGQKPAVRAYVTLAPHTERGQNTALYKTAFTDHEGRFSMKGIPPGPYSLFSFDAIPWGAGISADFHAKYRERGKTVIVDARGKAPVQLDLISLPWLTASPVPGR